MSTRSRRSARSLDELVAQLRDEYGPRARIVSAERVRPAGLLGLFRRARVEAVVEIADPPPRVRRPGAARDDLSLAEPVAHRLIAPTARRDAASLLVDDLESDPSRRLRSARDADASRSPRTPTADIPASTPEELAMEHAEAVVEEFDHVLAALRAELGISPGASGGAGRESGRAADSGIRADGFRGESRYSARAGGAADATGAPATGRAEATRGGRLRRAYIAAPVPPLEPPRAGPRPRTGAGDLVLVIGVGADATRLTDAIVATSPLAERARAAVGGAADRGHRSGPAVLATRRDALAARAHAVAGGGAVIVEAALPDRPLAAAPDSLHHLDADQVWLVLDATRKEADTAALVRAITATLPVDALAVVGADRTATPASVLGHGIPLGWVDGRFSPRR